MCVATQELHLGALYAARCVPTCAAARHADNARLRQKQRQIYTMQGCAQVQMQGGAMKQRLCNWPETFTEQRADSLPMACMPVPSRPHGVVKQALTTSNHELWPRLFAMCSSSAAQATRLFAMCSSSAAQRKQCMRSCRASCSNSTTIHLVWATECCLSAPGQAARSETSRTPG